jgi:hypothetical protein
MKLVMYYNSVYHKDGETKGFYDRLKLMGKDLCSFNLLGNLIRKANDKISSTLYKGIKDEGECGFLENNSVYSWSAVIDDGSEGGVAFVASARKIIGVLSSSTKDLFKEYGRGVLNKVYKVFRKKGIKPGEIEGSEGESFYDRLFFLGIFVSFEVWLDNGEKVAVLNIEELKALSVEQGWS